MDHGLRNTVLPVFAFADDAILATKNIFSGKHVGRYTPTHSLDRFLDRGFKPTLSEDCRNLDLQALPSIRRSIRDQVNASFSKLVREADCATLASWGMHACT